MSIIERIVSRIRGVRSSPTSPVSCEEALRHVQEFLDGELEGATLKEIEAHFETCQRCYPHLQFERSFREAVRRAAFRESAPEALLRRVTRVIANSGTDA
jgi:anti-sigma factor (TIGR02949 family)